ncbi:PREDICTED: receptor-like cytosolic serine/threonine-protein kinase RBK2 isoform X2 [Tarenaya hassleriana]|uniref:receptor-like cytosolic serine/threonine-protein kinase RBK2 isoform X2 n=1 Tax=Tarenaya hassleriana TaxID=28532 RepID=UPI00053C84B0|nr:PREDICTED: receptor-like cytosolic serine/threonine-protein kinase RBK2 isoform X2 [Tarenaya hassleriana]
MKYIRSNSFKRLFSFKRRSFDADSETSPVEEAVKADKFFEGFHETEKFQRPTWRCFSFEELFDATKCFSPENLVGRGGFAEVYKGVMGNGEEIAVKRITRGGRDERREKEFLTEIGTIGHVSHPNVLSLLGCCIDNGLYLVFRFSSRGSVASLLHDASLPPLEWERRYKIGVGTAKGLHYLHKGCQRRIIHRDIKSSNVLLTHDFEPQISDFGLAKWLPSQWSHHSIAPIEGTFGHLAPEYYTHGIVDEKTDVFAFGVFLLELISGRKPVDASHQSLHTLAKPILRKGEIEKLVDPRLHGEYNVHQLHRLAFAASLCIRSSTSSRPSMIEGDVCSVLAHQLRDSQVAKCHRFLRRMNYFCTKRYLIMHFLTIFIL